jgi:tetratricopeptide (TPR) repeat protein
MTQLVSAQRDRDSYGSGPQTVEVLGQVRLADTGGYAKNIIVRLEKFSGGVIDQMPTDDHGRFRFGNLARGYYKVVIDAPGLRPSQQDADLQVLFRAYLVFDLTADTSSRKTNNPLFNDVIEAQVPANARDEFSRGRTAFAQKDLDEAVAHLQRAVFLYDRFFNAHLLLATVFMDRRQWLDAERSLQRAFDLKPDDPVVLIALGEVCWRQKRYADAEKLLLEGLKLDDKAWHGQFTLARLYWEMGDVMKAAQPAGRTLQLKPDFAEAHLLAGNILLKLQQQQRAVMEYDEYLRLAPKGEFAAETRKLVDKLRTSPPPKH